MIKVLKYQLGTSKLMLGILIFLHGIVIVSLYFLPINWWLYLTFVFAIVVSGLFFISKYVYGLHSDVIVGIEAQTDGHWLMMNREGEISEGELLASSFRSNFLLILNFKLLKTKSKKTLIVVTDALPEKLYRQLCLDLLKTFSLTENAVTAVKEL